MTQQNACLKAFLPLLLRYQNSGVSLPFFTKHFSLLPKFLVPLSCRLYNILSTKLEWWSICLAMWWWWSSFRSDLISMFFGQMLPSLLMWLFGLYDFWWFFQFDFSSMVFLLWTNLNCANESRPHPTLLELLNSPGNRYSTNPNVLWSPMKRQGL